MSSSFELQTSRLYLCTLCHNLMYYLRRFYTLLCSQHIVLLVHCLRHTSTTQTLPQCALSSPVCDSSGYSQRWYAVTAMLFIRYSASSESPINNFHSPSSKDTSNDSYNWYQLINFSWLSLGKTSPTAFVVSPHWDLNNRSVAVADCFQTPYWITTQALGRTKN
jgi:hypothetical protein